MSEAITEVNRDTFKAARRVAQKGKKGKERGAR